MKRILRISAAALLLLSMILPVSAEETVPQTQVCTIRADSVTGKTGETVTVPVRIENNGGFTNFGIALDYDRQKLELVSIALSDEENPYLCGSFAESSIAWESENASYGYVTCALEEAAAEDGVLFAATFRLTEDFREEAAVTPVVTYIRSYDPQAQIFDDLACTALAGSIGETVDTVAGDADGDGLVSPRELIGVVRAYREDPQDPSVLHAADTNGNGIVDPAELIRVIRNYRGG